MKSSKGRESYKTVLVFSNNPNPFLFLLSPLKKKKYRIFAIQMDAKAIERIDKIRPGLIVFDRDSLASGRTASEIVEGIMGKIKERLIPVKWFTEQPAHPVRALRNADLNNFRLPGGKRLAEDLKERGLTISDTAAGFIEASIQYEQFFSRIHQLRREIVTFFNHENNRKQKFESHSPWDSFRNN